MAQRANAPLLWIDHLPVHQLCGAEGEGSNGGEGGDDGKGGKTGDGGQGSGGQGGSGSGQSAAPETVSKADYEALQARMAAADKNKTAAEKRLQELEDAGKGELQKAKDDLAAANKRAEELVAKQQGMSINNSFLTAKDLPTFHSNAAALQLLDRSGLTIEDDGTVKGMDAAINKLKTDHPYLVKESTGDGKDDKDKGGNGNGGQGGNGQQQRKSGSGNNGGGGGGNGTSREALEKRFPALRGRTGSTGNN